ncbi:hypothetical protein ABZ498_06450 [Streptomyces lavendulocolor]|uniref:hypothetical protein n=1 Tax=Streptomyces lavendulocolor TaxID=67316 RepID=UPI0033CCF4C8
MTSNQDHRPGQWPVKHPVYLEPVPADEEPTPARPPVEVAVPEVRLVVTVDLTGFYGSDREVTADLYEQTRHSTACHTAIVRLGEDALRCSLSLGHAIASRFFLAAQRIEVHVPAGTRWAYLADEVQQHLRHFAADQAQTLSKTG